MSYNKNGANQYKTMGIKTANRGQILIMLYEAAIKHVKKAAECVEKKDVVGKGSHIIKAHDIVNELANSLNFDVGGQIAQDLQRLYNFMVEQLIKANMENSKEPLLAVAKLLETLLDGWKQAVDKFQKENAEALKSGGAEGSKSG
ncbi:flagellar export chaperone FliS [bacterium]|jgi:flagellar protein FliS|nr:flagellar export chaperone FliS [bacterium]